MATFCGSCGSPLNDQADFCGGCGAPVPRGPQTISRPASPVATGGAYAPVRTTPASAAPAPAPAAKSSNALLKVGLVLVAILFVGGLAAFAAVYYAAHKVSEKIHAVAQGDLGGSKPGGGSAGGLLTSLTGSAGSQAQTSGATDSAGPGGDLCRFLSKEDVSSSTGTTIIRADPAPDGCVYIAHGDPADALTKHMGGMLAKKGADAKSQEMLQKFAGGMFKQQEQSDKNLSAEASTGEIPVITLSQRPWRIRNEAQQEIHAEVGCHGPSRHRRRSVRLSRRHHDGAQRQQHVSDHVRQLSVHGRLYQASGAESC
jgi:hypothetical protein